MQVDVMDQNKQLLIAVMHTLLSIGEVVVKSSVPVNALLLYWIVLFQWVGRTQSGREFC